MKPIVVKVPSQSQQGRFYTLRKRRVWECSCPGYKYTGGCKHVTWVREAERIVAREQEQAVDVSQRLRKSLR